MKINRFLKRSRTTTRLALVVFIFLKEKCRIISKKTKKRKHFLKKECISKKIFLICRNESPYTNNLQ